MVMLSFHQILCCQDISEYTIKAVFIEKFTQFVEWPSDSSFIEDNTHFYITVIGENPFGNRLDEMYLNQLICDKPVVIRYIEKIEEIHPSHILFISSSECDHIDKILQYTKYKPVLTIGDTKGYGYKGVLINFYLLDNKIKFEINESAVKMSNLYISYRLLSSAKIIEPIDK
jgi:hypothetical protein